MANTPLTGTNNIIISNQGGQDEQTDYTNANLDKEFQFEKSGEDLEAYVEDIAETVRIGLDQSIAILTPWFFNNMPRIYYQTTPRAEKVRHLSAIITGHVFETKQTVELWNRDHTKVTYIGPGSDKHILLDMASKLEPIDIKMGSLYFSRDKLLFLSSFIRKNYKKADYNNKHVISKTKEARKLLDPLYPNDKEQIDHYFEHIDHDFVVYATPTRLQKTYKMLKHMTNHQGAHTFVEPFENSPTARLTLGIKGVNISEILGHILHLINRYGFDILRSFVIQFEKGYDEAINVLHFVMKLHSGEKVDTNHISIIKLIKAVRTLGWVDSDEYNEFSKPPMLLSVNAANLIRSMAEWVHIILGKENIYYYSNHKIIETFRRHVEITKNIVDLFRLKFSPLKAAERQQGGYAKLRQEIVEQIENLIDRVERHIFRECVKFTDHVLKTNYFLPTKTGQAFRLSPDILDPKYYPQKPYGIFYITGKDYRFFQVRWKDVARGGLRVVMPKTSIDHGYAISGLFDEVYGLSLGQQLKNKDIPEGGSKAVMVLKPGGNKVRAVRGGINALLDLLVSEDESHESHINKQISYYPEEEIIYLGPDENMTNDLIVWVPQQAERRGYQYSKAFISSKPGEGINHKEYGVTSEGVHVFVDHTLKFLNIDPKQQKFTIKMTGGPDGDVAGNELKILHREYGENARVVAIADGYGAAHDPLGLNWDELLRLASEELSINHFDESKLGNDPTSFVINADTNENIRKRNELHSNAVADIFIPAGGRPYTVNGNNYKHFIQKDGTPTCKAIIEGANIFFTEEARDKLQGAGIIMIKDSSANKTGVICSSYEIIASLLLTKEEFAQIKSTYVEQVIDILRHKAAVEAKLLFNEFSLSRNKKNLVELSKEISKEINLVTDTLLDEFLKNKDEILANPLFQNLILRHCPPILKEKYEDRILNDLPAAHRIAILAAFIASHIVYNEGLGWLESISEGERFDAAMIYMEHDVLAEKLISTVTDSSLNDKSSIIDILKRSAARDLTMLKLERQHK